MRSPGSHCVWGWVGAKERESLGGGPETCVPPTDLLCSLSSCLWPAFRPASGTPCTWSPLAALVFCCCLFVSWFPWSACLSVQPCPRHSTAQRTLTQCFQPGRHGAGCEPFKALSICSSNLIPEPPSKGNGAIFHKPKLETWGPTRLLHLCHLPERDQTPESIHSTSSRSFRASTPLCPPSLL